MYFINIYFFSKLQEILNTDPESLKNRLSIKMNLDESPDLAYIKLDCDILRAEMRNLPTPVRSIDGIFQFFLNFNIIYRFLQNSIDKR